MFEPITLGDLSRREFFKTIALTTAAIVLLPTSGYADTGATTPYVDLGKSTQFGADWTRVVLPKEYRLEVVYVRSVVAGSGPATFQAISARCTHKGCTVAYTPDDKQFHCPCHGAIFGTDAQNVSGPQHRPAAHLDPLHPLATLVSDAGHLLAAAPPMISTGDD